MYMIHHVHPWPECACSCLSDWHFGLTLLAYWFLWSLRLSGPLHFCSSVLLWGSLPFTFLLLLSELALLGSPAAISVCKYSLSSESSKSRDSCNLGFLFSRSLVRFIFLSLPYPSASRLFGSAQIDRYLSHSHIVITDNTLLIIISQQSPNKSDY